MVPMISFLSISSSWPCLLFQAEHCDTHSFLILDTVKTGTNYFSSERDNKKIAVAYLVQRRWRLMRGIGRLALLFSFGHFHTFEVETELGCGTKYFRRLAYTLPRNITSFLLHRSISLYLNFSLEAEAKVAAEIALAILNRTWSLSHALSRYCLTNGHYCLKWSIHKLLLSPVAEEFNYPIKFVDTKVAAGQFKPVIMLSAH